MINPVTHAITEFGGGTDFNPESITAGPDGNLWFTDTGRLIGTIDPTTHAITESPLPSGAGVSGITAGPDGNVWFADPYTDQIGEVVLREVRPAPLTFTVNSTADTNIRDNVLTLREAILVANGFLHISDLSPAEQQQLTPNPAAGKDTIAFNIPGGGVQTITLQSQLPAITDSVIINGYTQPGSSPNTLAVGDNAVLLVRLDGSAAGIDGLVLSANDSTVQGLDVTGFRANLFGHGFGIVVKGSNDVVQGNFIGVSPDGTTSAGNTGGGVLLDGSAASVNNTIIGGTTPAARNLISDNGISGDGFPGVQIRGPLASGNTVTGNYVGTDRTGTVEIWNGAGISVNDATGTVIQGNLISGNIRGIDLQGDGTLVQGNLIGTKANGVDPLGNGVGIQIDGNHNQIGGRGSGQGNTIAFNGPTGVHVDDGGGNTISGNSIFSNRGYYARWRGSIVLLFDDDLGIQVWGMGISSMPSQCNEPVLTSVSSAAGGIVSVSGTMSASPNQTYTIEFFSNEQEAQQGSGQGRHYLSFTTVQTDSSGFGAFTVSLAGVDPSLTPFITATATDAAGTTSVFSHAYKVDYQPPTISIAGLTAGVPGQGLGYTVTLDAGTQLPPNTLPYNPYEHSVTSNPLHWSITKNGSPFFVPGGFGDVPPIYASSYPPNSNNQYVLPAGFTPDDITDPSGTDTYVISVSATMMYGGTGYGSLTVRVSRVAVQGTDLAIGGTSGNDTYLLNAAGTGGVSVTFNGTSLGTFTPTGFVRIFDLNGGDDTYTINSTGAAGLSITDRGGHDTYTINSMGAAGVSIVDNFDDSVEGDTYTISGVGAAGALIDDSGHAPDNLTVNLGNLLGPVTVYDVPLSAARTAVTINGTSGADYITKTGFGYNPSISWGPAVWNGTQATSPNPNAEVVSLLISDGTYAPSLTINGRAGRDYIKDPGNTPTTLLGGPDDDTIVLANANNVLADGGDGSDTYVVQFGGTLGAVTIADSGKQGTDTLTVVAAGGSDPLTVSTTQVSQGSGTVTLASPLAITLSTPPGTQPVVLTGGAILEADPLSPSQTMLVVGGTEGNDNLSFTPGGSAGDVVVKLNQIVLGTFHPTSRIVAYGYAGDDDIQVAGGITLPTWLYGGDGNDRLKGGNGPNVLEGGAGDDLVVGGEGRDLLVGGGGADRLIGNGGDDILLGGTTSYDGNETALAAIMAEWTSAHDFATRVANLTDTGIGLLSRFNGDYFLLDSGTGQTVFNDTSRDTLTGNLGSDWFFAGSADKITDLSDSDRAFIFGV
jgi:CSLREA domain-containing protein